MAVSSQLRVLICFDGSDGSINALETAGRLFPGAAAKVVHVWHAPLPYGGVSYGGQIVLPADVRSDLRSKAGRNAEEIAERGQRLARGAGLHATHDSIETPGPVWRVLLDAAEDDEADVIVAGSRGYGEFRALVLGSTSTALSHHSRIPLLIVPGHEDETRG